MAKYSYSKLNTFESCPWKYKLTYVDGHYTFSDSLVSEFGTLLHSVEEQIGNSLKEGKTPDYDYLKDYFQNANIPKKDKFDTDGGIYGINILKEKYKKDFYEVNEKGASYYTKALDYLTNGIYRLENYLKENPTYEIFDTERPFSADYNGNVLSGFIDRIFYDKVNGEYIIEDIKTKDKPFKNEELTTPLQFVVYVYSLCKELNISYDKVSCYYDLPVCNMRQKGGTKGFIDRGLKKLDSIFGGINDGECEPKPSPLCHWCSYCPTNPTQPEAGKFLCPYYSKWTRENKTHTVAHKWQGLDKHNKIMEKEILKLTKECDIIKSEDDFDF